MSARELTPTYRCKILSCFWVRRDVIPGYEVPPKSPGNSLSALQTRTKFIRSKASRWHDLVLGLIETLLIFIVESQVSMYFPII